ncbi:MAG: hypothetical protein JWM75_2940, partial [Sphingomonas bacterium]|nr:hypothetical protein [Sphingomonas bacterium]
MPADPERALTIAYAPAALRAGLSALWRLDERLAAVVAATRDDRIGEIRLAWWRESLERLDTAPPPDEPMLREAAAILLPLGLSGTGLGQIADGWAALLEPSPLSDDALVAHARQRGGILFEQAGTILGAQHGELGNELGHAGEGWALVDLAWHVRDPATAERALTLARSRLAGLAGLRWPKALRPLGALAVLAAR